MNDDISTEKTDVWQFGAILYELFSGRIVFEKTNADLFFS